MSKYEIEDNDFKKFEILLLFEAIDKTGAKMNQVSIRDDYSDD